VKFVKVFKYNIQQVCTCWIFIRRMAGWLFIFCKCFCSESEKQC